MMRSRENWRTPSCYFTECRHQMLIFLMIKYTLNNAGSKALMILRLNPNVQNKQNHYNIQFFASFQTLVREVPEKQCVYSASQPAKPEHWPFMDNQILAALKQANKPTHWLNINRKRYNLMCPDPPYDSTIPPPPILSPRTVNWVTHTH